MSVRDHVPSSAIYLRMLAEVIRSSTRPLDLNDASQLDAAAGIIHESSRLFDLRWDARMRAIKRWQGAHPGNELVWPDEADLVVWLMCQLEGSLA